MTEVYVVTNPELGWDCVIGVFDANSVSKSKLEEVFPSELAYVVHFHPNVHKDTYNFEEPDDGQ